MKACSSMSLGIKRRDKRESLVVCYSTDRGVLQSSGETLWFHMAEQETWRKGTGEKQLQGEEEKTRKRQKKDLGCLYPGIQAVGSD